MAFLGVGALYLYYRTEKGEVRAVDGLSLHVDEGESLGIIGESGCGKTSLALSIIRLLPNNVSRFDGRITLDGLELMSLSEEEMRSRVRWRSISMVFQGALNALNPVVRIGDQIAEPLLASGACTKHEAKLLAVEKMKAVGLQSDIYSRYPHELSGGMKQRVVIAMSLIMDPKLVILDEPTSALDVSIQAQIMNLLKRLKRELGLSMIFITHDIALASDICDRLAVMYAGELVEDGVSEQLLLTPGHPYTQKLLASIPRLRGGSKPEFIPGAPPDLTSPPLGCRFHPRCPFSFDPCAKISPPSFPIGVQQRARCWLLGERS